MKVMYLHYVKFKSEEGRLFKIANTKSHAVSQTSYAGANGSWHLKDDIQHEGVKLNNILA